MSVSCDLKIICFPTDLHVCKCLPTTSHACHQQREGERMDLPCCPLPFQEQIYQDSNCQGLCRQRTSSWQMVVMFLQCGLLGLCTSCPPVWWQDNLRGNTGEERGMECTVAKSLLSINGAHHNQACHHVAASLLFTLLTPGAGISYNCGQPDNNFNAIVLGINVIIACRTVRLLGANPSWFHWMHMERLSWNTV